MRKPSQPRSQETNTNGGARYALFTLFPTSPPLLHLVIRIVQVLSSTQIVPLGSFRSSLLADTRWLVSTGIPVLNQAADEQITNCCKRVPLLKVHTSAARRMS